MTTFTVTNASTLFDALAAAVGGDRIELTAGDYGSLDITGVGATFTSDVTIVSADPTNPAIVHELIVNNSNRIVFDGILFDYVAGPVFRPFWVKGSTFVTVRNSVFDGALVSSGSGEFGTGYALHVTDSADIVVENNEFFDFSRGVVVYRSTNLIVSANDIHSLSSDGMNFVSVDGLLIEGNWIHDFKIDPDGGAHPDMIQFWVAAGETPAQNVTIRGNFFDSGIGDWTQTIFMGNGLAGGNFEQYAYRNILIEDNVIFNDHVHGISIGETALLIIRNNTLVHNPSTNNMLGWPPQTRLTETSLNVTIENHITQNVWNWEVVTDQPTWTVVNNLLLEYDPNATVYYNDLFVNAKTFHATLADLRAVAGGIIEQGGYGAAMTRADIPLVVGPNVEVLPPPPETGVCEALLAEALAVVADLEAQLTSSQSALASMTVERNVAIASLASMTTLWSEAVAALVAAQAALADMTIERDAAWLAQSVAEDALVAMTTERDAALTALTDAEVALVSMTTERDVALADLVTVQTQLTAAVDKLTAIHVISGG